ncbi:MAG: GntR family transcriptional regulator [Fibrobacteraceae bacterium]|nr:GntR family transcriptional regulator [Fibrobacteraceae bacterium]
MKEFVIQALLSSTHSNGNKLPSVRTLMSSLKASSGTVQNALHELIRQGLIYSIRNKGCFWGRPPKLSSISLPETPVQKLESEIFSDFRAGMFPPDKELPSLKELRTRYHVSLAILKKFLLKEQEKGTLGRIGKGRFFFVKSKMQVKESEILFITRSTPWGEFSPASEREMDFIRLVYRTGASKHFKLRLLGYDELSERFVDRSGNVRRLSEYSRVTGAIVSTLLVQKPLGLLNALSKVPFPISVWWEHPKTSLSNVFLKQRGHAFFNSTFGEVPGEITGKFLLSKGFHKATFISPYHASSWSIDRLNGIKKSGIKIEELVDSKYASPWDFRELARKNGPKYTVELRARKLEESIVEKLIRNAIKADVWIAVNDEVAGILLEIAEKKVIKDLPYMLGFDNSAESYLLRLDSFDFNTEALVLQMFYHLEVGKREAFSTNKIRNISGNVVEK